MISLADRFQSRTKQLTEKAGQTVTYKHFGGVNDYDPDTGMVVSDNTITIKAFKTQVSDSEAKSPNLVGKEVSAFLLAGVDFTFVPRVGDEITYSVLTESYTLRVQMIKEHWMGGKVAQYRLLCTAT